MKKFLKWWKVWGQVWGFLLLVFTTSFPFLNDTAREYTNDNVWVGIIWLILCFWWSCMVCLANESTWLEIT
jgi:hypothetical protein